jgi:hypothetical protein
MESFYLFFMAVRTLGTKSKIHHSPLGTLAQLYIGTIGAGKFFVRRDFAQLLCRPLAKLHLGEGEVDREAAASSLVGLSKGCKR